MSAQEPLPPVFNGRGYVIGHINQLGEYVPVQDNNSILAVAVDEPFEYKPEAFDEAWKAVQSVQAEGEQRIDQHAPGAKLDDGKIDMSLLEFFAEALEEICRVGSYGQEKYTRGGFLVVPDGIRRYTAAMFRHFFKERKEKFDTDPWYDTPKGLAYKDKVRHDAQVAWNAIARLQLRLNEERGHE